MRTTVEPGAVVRGSDGQLIGRVRDVYLHDRTGELAAITVQPGQLSSRNVLIPAVAIADPDGPDRSDGSDAPTDAPAEGRTDRGPGSDAPADGRTDRGSGSDGGPGPGTSPAEMPPTEDTTVHLTVDSLAVRAGISAPDTGHATPVQLNLAARELGVEEAAAG